jgi:hypothetical protein
MKTVKTRDSATTILRKLGVNSRDYALFIGKNASGLFEVDVDKASAHLKAPDSGAPVEAPVVIRDSGKAPIVSRTAVVQKMVDSTKPKEKKLSISGMAEQLLLAGKTNAETWTQLKERFKLGDDKKHYPSWFRSRLRRQGRLAKKEKKS